MEKKIEFVHNSLLDIQGTIRALDAKFFGMIALFLLPITEIDEITKSFNELCKHSPILTIITFSILLICWILGLVISFMGVLSINNPSKNIQGKDELKIRGVFYNSHLFKPNFFNQFNTKRIKSSKTIKQVIESFDLNEKERFNELIFEQTKLVYIRDLKIVRQKVSVINLLITLLIIITVLILKILIQNNA